MRYYFEVLARGLQGSSHTQQVTRSHLLSSAGIGCFRLVKMVNDWQVPGIRL